MMEKVLMKCRQGNQWLRRKAYNILQNVVAGCVEGIGLRHKDSEKPYCSVYQKDKDYSKYDTDIKAIAFYLPQFHTFPENDRWWGKGFTEWTNTRRGKPRFPGHYQPRRPHPDIGYYDLSVPDSISKQIFLANQHKLYGFCFYCYWFSGKALMQKPLELLVEHPEWETHFCLCWANENFTRTWDGMETDVLLKQEYRRDDARNFILHVKKYMRDIRYIRIDQKPVLVVYDPGGIPDIKNVIRQWRETAREEGLGELLIWMCRTNSNTAAVLQIEKWIDAEVEFPPNNMWWHAIRENKKKASGSHIFSYPRLVRVLVYKLRREQKKKAKRRLPLYHTCMLGWDNSCRRKHGWTVYKGFSLDYFKKWVLEIVKTLRARPDDEQIFFINAWNEWGEGTYLEPDETYGYASINTLSECICKNWRIENNG